MLKVSKPKLYEFTDEEIRALHVLVTYGTAEIHKKLCDKLLGYVDSLEAIPDWENEGGKPANSQ